MLPGASREQKKSLARKLKKAMAEELRLNPTIISVSVVDLPIDKWEKFIDNIPDDSIIIPETDNNEDTFYNFSCCFDKPT